MQPLATLPFLLLFSRKVSFAWISQPVSSRKRVLHSRVSSVSDDNAQILKEKAEQLRQEISAFEETKSKLEQEKQRQIVETLQEQQALRERYSAILPILKPDGSTIDEQIQFPPYHNDGSSYIITCEATLPLGLVLGESEDFAGAIVVDQVVSKSNGDQAGVRVGDIVRAFTACKLQMEQPAWQLMAGGIGRPKMYRYIHPVGVDKRVSFEMHLEALVSNRLDPDQRPVLPVLERQEA
jgi:hypothetical protein